MARISPATADDLPAIVALLTEIDTFYNAASQPSDTERATGAREALFGDPPVAHALIAWDGTSPVGLAVYSVLWPAAGVERSLYLKELYVGAGHRQAGTGTDLIQAVIDDAGDRGCTRIEWTADTDNPLALAFYDRLGIPPLATKVFYRLSADSSLGIRDS